MATSAVDFSSVAASGDSPAASADAAGTAAAPADLPKAETPLSALWWRRPDCQRTLLDVYAGADPAAGPAYLYSES